MGSATARWLTADAPDGSIIDVPMEKTLKLTDERKAALLGGCPLFSGVRPSDLAAVAGRAVEIEFPADRVIARQGEIGTGFFVVVEGSVRVVRDGEELAILGPGGFFGEISVLDGLPRVAQVVAIERTRCLGLTTWDFEQALLDNPVLALAILRGLATRVRSVTEQQHH